MLSVDLTIYESSLEGGDLIESPTFEECYTRDKTGIMLSDMFSAAISKDLRALYVMGEDPAITDADANHVRKGLKALDFLVVQDIFMSDTAKMADVVLPGASFAEKTGTFTNAERRIQMVNQAIKPIANAKTDGAIICELANRMGYPFPYDSSEQVMQEVASLTPLIAGVTHERLGTQGLQWPVLSADHPGSKVLHQETFTRGKGHFIAIAHQEANELPDEEYPFLLNTGRKLSHYNIFTQSSEALVSYSPEELAEINPLDAKRLNFEEGERVKVTSRRGELETKIVITERVPAGMIFMTFHYYDTPTNLLTNGAYDKVTKTYEFQSVVINKKLYQGKRFSSYLISHGLLHPEVITKKLPITLWMTPTRYAVLQTQL